MRRTPRYEIRLAAFYADNLMNSVRIVGRASGAQHRRKNVDYAPLVGNFGALRVEKKTDYAPLVGNFRGSTEKKHELRPACSGLSREKTDFAPLGNFRGSAEKKHGLRPACRKLPGLSREKTRITPRLSETSGAQQRKNTDFAPPVGNFRGSTEKTRITPLA